MNQKPRFILFVDEDPLILNGYRRSLENAVNWQCSFTNSGIEALDLLSTHPYNAVITGIQLPDMSGIKLLDGVCNEWPQVMRFMLSGDGDEQNRLLSASLAHQMFLKPVEMARVYEQVERACRLDERIRDPHLQYIVKSIKTLPSLPLLYRDLTEELRSDHASSASVAAIVQKDPAMTAKVLQLVNSAFFGIGEDIRDPKRAVSILGFDTIKALVLGHQIFHEFQGGGQNAAAIESLWNHSLFVSALAQRIARNLNLSTEEQRDAQVAGILHDIGKLLIPKALEAPQDFGPSWNGENSVQAEYRHLGTSHAELGAYLLGIWGLPNAIVEAVGNHHRPETQLTSKVELVTALHIANGLSLPEINHIEDGVLKRFDCIYLQKLGLLGRLEEWLVIAQDLQYQNP